MRAIVEREGEADRMRGLEVFPRIEYGTAGKYFDWLRSQDLSQVPVWRDELYLEYHEGTFTTQARMKEQNRKSETLLTSAEKFATLATLSGAKYDGAALEEAWRDVLFNQFHDLLPGSGIREIYLDAQERYRAAQEIGSHELNRSLDSIAATVDTSKARGTPVLVFNPLAWERSDLVRVRLPGDGDGDWAVFDALDVQEMRTAQGALREGVLYDLVGRIRHEDVRDRTIKSFTERYRVDLVQAGRVQRSAHALVAHHIVEIVAGAEHGLVAGCDQVGEAEMPLVLGERECDRAALRDHRDWTGRHLRHVALCPDRHAIVDIEEAHIIRPA